MPDSLYQPVKYILFSGGKRIRPFLMVESYKLFDNNLDRIIDFAIALELIHTYSLVHDDLPCMDDDDYRRGVLTVHKKYGEDIAVLTGDALLNMAFEILALRLKKSESETSSCIEAFYQLSNQAGSSGMIGGQILDMESESGNEDVDLIEMYSLKTGGLFKSATMVGGIVGGASSKEISLLGDMGQALGVSYQIKDDILDYDEDLDINKQTISTKWGIDRSKELSREYTEKTLELLEYFKAYNIDRLRAIVDLLLERTY